jgi:hypothetical protein
LNEEEATQEFKAGKEGGIQLLLKKPQNIPEILERTTKLVFNSNV